MLLRTDTRAGRVERLLTEACARNVPAELHYEWPHGGISVGRVRLLDLTSEYVMADRPLFVDDEGDIPPKATVNVHLCLGGTRYVFKSVVDRSAQRVRLNARQWVPGIALRLPKAITESQRRNALRVSVLGYDPISVDMVRPHPEYPDAVWINAEVITAWLVDVSVGGLGVLADHRVLDRVEQDERFFLSFDLPGVDEPLLVLGSVRYTRLVKRSDSIRLGIAFVTPESGPRTKERHLISRFIAETERRLLRRRK